MTEHAILRRMLAAALALALSAAAAGCGGTDAGPAGTTGAVATGTASPTAGSPAPEETKGSAGSITISAFPAVWRPEESSGIRISVKAGDGAALAGDWTATRGTFLLPSGEDGGAGGDTARKTVTGLSEVVWTLPENERAESGSVEVRFSRDGRVTVLILDWDGEAGRASVGEGGAGPRE